MSPSATTTVAFAVTSDPLAATPVLWNTLCRTARRLASEGYEIRIGAGPGGEQIVAEHALSTGGHVTLVLPQPGYEDAWVGQIRRWFPGQIAVEPEQSGTDGACNSLLAGSAFLVVLGVHQYQGRACSQGGLGGSVAPAACDRSVTTAIELADELGMAVYDLRDELSPSWVEEALEAAGRQAEPETGLRFRPEELDIAARDLPRQRVAGCGGRTHRAAPSLLRRVGGSRRPSSPGHRFAG
jgi:hypothetical protein